VQEFPTLLQGSGGGIKGYPQTTHPESEKEKNSSKEIGKNIDLLHYARGVTGGPEIKNKLGTARLEDELSFLGKMASPQTLKTHSLIPWSYGGSAILLGVWAVKGD